MKIANESAYLVRRSVHNDLDEQTHCRTLEVRTPGEKKGLAAGGRKGKKGGGGLIR